MFHSKHYKKSKVKKTQMWNRYIIEKENLSKKLEDSFINPQCIFWNYSWHPELSPYISVLVMLNIFSSLGLEMFLTSPDRQNLSDTHLGENIQSTSFISTFVKIIWFYLACSVSIHSFSTLDPWSSIKFLTIIHITPADVPVNSETLPVSYPLSCSPPMRKSV